MLSNAIWLLCLAAAGARAQDESSTVLSASGSAPSTTSSASSTRPNTYSELSFTNSYSTLTRSEIPTYTFTGSQYTYLVISGQVTRQSASSTTATGTSNSTSVSSNSQITRSTESVSLTQIGGNTATPTNGTSNSTTSSTTSSAAAPTNTVPCNGWPEFCTRKYSNVSMITSHNSAFVVPNNAASNQELSVLTQLNDGVRMLQGQVHYENNTMYNCHTSCDQLNAGTWQSELEVVRGWLQDNPYDVLTILIGNSDVRPVEDFVPAITNAGLLPYVYEPQYVPQFREQWPTLGEMILKNDRLVIFMDYEANQDSVPYVLDEFTHIFETPFSPVDQAFPCTAQRPPDLNETVAKEQYMYLANHNLNVAVDLSSLGISTDKAILIPNTAELNLTNGQQNIFGALGAMNVNCTQTWDRPPNFMLVDYYNRGSPEAGSVFHVAAAANGVEYTRECCGLPQSPATVARASFAALAGALLFTVLLAW
ncbi:putative PLC-like phosphodiesterase, TIM beta/alpha-barrel domain superfamily [Septoria linicola]|nr:putative PLC-like phosphodiesterase, TIM beta/alpha-barrel domain superfamily [Septoria linicola]